ncbi:MAG: nucleotidyltransferase domain-containing protein [Syntrophaceae bacterium]|nr:nucleotidyltransferase domain-containing protein [Syntrophaceae bacterium]
MLKEKFRELEELLLSEIEVFYGERLVSVVVFGSAARETQSFESDLDILIIAEGLPQGRMRRIREFNSVEERVGPFLKSLQQKEGINTYISALIKSPEEAQKGSPLFLDMVEDAKILFDKGGFFQGILERLREKLGKLGAKRVWKGNAWYWDLKPDYKFGDLIEL